MKYLCLSSRPDHYSPDGGITIVSWYHLSGNQTKRLARLVGGRRPTIRIPQIAAEQQNFDNSRFCRRPKSIHHQQFMSCCTIVGANKDLRKNESTAVSSFDSSGGGISSGPKSFHSIPTSFRSRFFISFTRHLPRILLTMHYFCMNLI